MGLGGSHPLLDRISSPSPLHTLKSDQDIVSLVFFEVAPVVQKDNVVICGVSWKVVNNVVMQATSGISIFPFARAWRVLE